MSNNKQSSVEWLFDNLNLCFDKFDNGEYSYTEFVNASNEIKEQAKAMHKEEQRLTYEGVAQNLGTSIKESDIPKFNDYYNETFGE